MPRIERFNPAVHDPTAYITNAPADERRTRSFLVLNSLMTKAIVESIGVVRGMPEDERGKIELLGGTPTVVEPNFDHLWRQQTRRLRGVGDVNDEGQLEVDKYYISRTRGISGINGFEVPVGQYGPRLAYATVQAARAVTALFKQVSQTHPHIMQAPDNYREALSVTFQNNIRGALLEGVQTLAGQFGLLSIRKIKDANGRPMDPMALYDAFRRDGTLNAWAAHAQFGRTAPQFSGHQLAVAEPVQVTEAVTGPKAKLTDRAKENLREYADAEVDGCPVARRNTPIVTEGQYEVVSDSGINLLADLFGLYLKHYYNAQRNEEDRQGLDREMYVPVLRF